METDGDVTRMIQQLRSDSRAVRNEAARQIWNRYCHRLLNLTRRHLDQSLRGRVDEEDLLQSIYKSFCLRQERGEFNLAGRDQLWGLLALITKRKAFNAAAHHRADKRNIDREQSVRAAELDTTSWGFENLEASDPTPLEAIILKESLAIRLNVLNDPELQAIALDVLAGWSNKEIATRRNCSMRSIERQLQLIRNLWTMEE